MKAIILTCIFLAATIMTVHAQDTIKKDNERFVTVTTTNGNTFAGYVISSDEKELVLQTDQMGRVAIPKYTIKKMSDKVTGQVVNGEYWFENPNATRYIIGPSAIPLRKGEGYYQNLYLFVHSGSVGLTDNISIGGGTELLTPIVTGQAPAMFFATAKAGFPVAERLHVGGGILYVNYRKKLFGSYNNHIGTVFGLTTYGSGNNNITVGAGWGYQQAGSDNPFSGKQEQNGGISKRPTFTVSAMARPFKWLSVVTENWVFPNTRNEYYAINQPPRKIHSYKYIFSYGLRVMGERVAVDMGFFNNPDISGSIFIGIPYIAVVVKFGGKKK